MKAPHCERKLVATEGSGVRLMQAARDLPCLMAAAPNWTQRSKGTRNEVRGEKAKMMRRPYSGMGL